MRSVTVSYDINYQEASLLYRDAEHTPVGGASAGIWTGHHTRVPVDHIFDLGYGNQ